MDVEEDDGFHSLDEEDKIFDEIKQEILDEESTQILNLYDFIRLLIKFYFCVLVKWISEQNANFNVYIQHLQNNSIECPVCHTGNFIKTSTNTISCDVCHTSIQTFLEIETLKSNLENTAAKHSRSCQSPIECTVFSTPCDNSMFMLCNICQFLFQIS